MWILSNDWLGAAKELAGENGRWPRRDAPQGQVQVGFDTHGQPRLKPWRYGERAVVSTLFFCMTLCFLGGWCLSLKGAG